MQRGDIWWASLPRPIGPEPGKRRPFVVVQADTFNASRISTVIAAVLTSNLRLAYAPGNVLLPANVTGLPKDSVVNVSQVVTIDRSFMTRRVARLPEEYMVHIDTGLRAVLDL